MNAQTKKLIEFLCGRKLTSINCEDQPGMTLCFGCKVLPKKAENNCVNDGFYVKTKEE